MSQNTKFEHRFGEDFSIDEKGCLRCSNYLGYGVYKIRDLPDGKVQHGIRVLCKARECVPNLKPITCNYCGQNLLEAIEKETDEELKIDLKKLGMCPSCHENWREKCLCFLCHFDYPSSSRIKGKKGNYCFCLACEWSDECPEKQKSFPDCFHMKEISKEKATQIVELV